MHHRQAPFLKKIYPSLRNPAAGRGTPDCCKSKRNPLYRRILYLSTFYMCLRPSLKSLPSHPHPPIRIPHPHTHIHHAMDGHTNRPVIQSAGKETRLFQPSATLLLSHRAVLRRWHMMRLRMLYEFATELAGKIRSGRREDGRSTEYNNKRRNAIACHYVPRYYTAPLLGFWTPQYCSC